MKNPILFLIAAVLVVGAGYYWYQYRSQPEIIEQSIDQIKTLRGEVADIALGAEIIIIKDEAEKETNLIISPQSKLFDNSNKEVGLNFFQKGFYIEAKGKEEDGNFLVDEIKTLEAPNIIVFSPKPNETVGGTIIVKGKARVFDGSAPLTINPEFSRRIENQFSLRVLTDSQKIYEANITADSPDTGLYGDFEKRIDLDSSVLKSATSLTLEVFDNSAKDGSEIDKVSIPLSFSPGDTIKIKAYFLNNRLDPQISCNKVFSVERTVPKTFAVVRASLEELLKGPNDKEKEDGYSTSINQGVLIQKLGIENGVANVDFNNQLQYQAGGSCRVEAIRTQITETLKQFPGVSSVVISVNGNSTSTLQP